MKYSKNFDCNKTEQAKNKLIKYIQDDWKIFVDTCSFLYEKADIFFPFLIECLTEYNGKIFVSTRVIEELSKKSGDKNLEVKANNALNYIKQMQSKNIVDIRGDKNDNFADNVFQVVFTKFRMRHKLLLITQDVNLAEDINSLNDNKSVKGYPIHVQKISRFGFLSSFNFSDDKTRKKEKFTSPTNTVKSNEKIDKFKLATELTKLTDITLNPSFIPAEGDEVLGSGAKVRLLSKISEGGEGIIYETNTPYVAKIYKKEKNTLLRYEKIKLMASKRLVCAGICYPIDILFNQRNEFVGYLMPKAKGKTLQRSFFIKPLLEKNFPSWNKLDSVRLCITILEKIKYLHDRNIILGDINPENILLVSPTEVYFVDTDSYQLEGFPCPVGTVNYTAPEIQKKGNYKDYLRTFGNENFAIATLLFMIMLPGKPPYAQQGGESQQQNILNMDFSYPFEEYSNKKTADGPWRYMWSHLTYELKKAFFYTFRKNGEYSMEDTRLNVDKWLAIFRTYENLLSSGKLTEQDAMSMELFPTRHKKHPNATYITCKVCQEEVNEEFSKVGVCSPCLKRSEQYTCAKCSKKIVYNNYQKYVKQQPKPNLCHTCENIAYESTCIDCNNSFSLSKQEYAYFQSKGFDMPKRCKNCRGTKGGNPMKAKQSSKSVIGRNTSSSIFNLFKLF